jgi:predicted lipoprotein with Yx(FWY)xxD motif
MRSTIAKVALAAAFFMLVPMSSLAAQRGDTTAAMPAGVKVATTTAGPTLVNAQGMTLYTWGNDTIPGKSVCNGNCATNWPPLMAAADARPMGNWTVITRDDNSKQWAYKGKPLYLYRMDTKAGDVVGNGRGTWVVAKP